MITDITLKSFALKLFSEVIKEALEATHLMRGAEERKDWALKHLYVEKLRMVSSIISSVLPGISTNTVKEALLTIPESEINPFTGIDEIDIENVVAKIENYNREDKKNS